MRNLMRLIPSSAPRRRDLAATEANDTLSATTTVLVGAALTATEGADTLSAAANGLIGGSLAITEAADTLTAAASVIVGGALATTETQEFSCISRDGARRRYADAH
jgi:ammonia channel protein AmtB